MALPCEPNHTDPRTVGGDPRTHQALGVETKPTKGRRNTHHEVALSQQRGGPLGVRNRAHGCACGTRTH